MVIHFSQTGHTRRVAECIAGGIQEITGKVTLVGIAEADRSKFADYDLIGFGCPVFYYQEPINVRRFLTELPELDGRFWFLFCTHGSVMGKIFSSMSALVAEKGINILGYHDTYADATLPFYPHPTLTTGHPDSTDLEQARAFGRAMAQERQRIAGGGRFVPPEPAPVPEEWAAEAEKFTPEFLERIMPRLGIDRDKCSQCYECETTCPVNGIEIDAAPPRIQKPCIYCWRCVLICPDQAVQADWDGLVAIAPKAYKRYRQALDQAAARGEYEWKIDPDSIRVDEPLYKKLEGRAKR